MPNPFDDDTALPWPWYVGMLLLVAVAAVFRPLETAMVVGITFFLNLFFTWLVSLFTRKKKARELKETLDAYFEAKEKEHRERQERFEREMREAVRDERRHREDLEQRQLEQFDKVFPPGG